MIEIAGRMLLALVAALPVPLVSSALVIGLLRWFHGERRVAFLAD